MRFQAYLDNIEKTTGLTPRQFIARAQERGSISRPSRRKEFVQWLKDDYDLRRGMPWRSSM